ncbi:FkbM family methyltransferase [Hyphomicrobium facile]|uniref:Methyltransferase, FkbM family n=1 Tax=Hyphomicrobium facile TaxID=51670 RepID=A0A1I7NHM1_9HYPH|nr:FkbM family methyltransferase [Hyphomicrobium facile]SFV34159.1 methyltransferase, FkbM family [Hyphomicrobium facile]
MTVAHDRYWRDAAAFVASCDIDDKLAVGPAEFRTLVSSILPYDQLPGIGTPDLLVVHKGQMDLIGADRLEKLTRDLGPAFANEVFVIFARGGHDRSVMKSDHFKAFRQTLSAMLRPKATPVAQETRPAVYLGQNVALTKTIYGHKIYVDTRDCSLTPHLLLDGYWEQWITNVFRTLVRPGMKVIDVGANVGWYSLLAADLIGPSGRLVSFEANPELSELTYRNLMVNGFMDRSTIVPSAVFSECKQIDFKICNRNIGSSGIFVTPESAAAFNDSVRVLSVNAVTLDSYFPAGTKIDFIKIDAEGAEPFVLKGATRLLRENPHIQIMMEFAPAMITGAYGSIEKFYDELKAYGFTIFRIEHDSSLAQASLEELSATSHCDVVLKH